MARPARIASALLACCIVSSAGAGLVDVAYDGPAAPAPRCDVVEIDLVVASDDGADQPFNGIDVIMIWDPSRLELLGFDQSGAGVPFFITGFLNDPDDINDDITDGEVIFTALAQIGVPALAPPAPDQLVVTTFQFRALVDGPTTVSTIATSGAFGLTQVRFGGDVTGDISDVASVTVGTCPGDFNADGEVAFDDLLQLLSNWGLCPDPCCREDLNNNDEVEFQDLLVVLSEWGPCP